MQPMINLFPKLWLRNPRLFKPWLSKLWLPKLWLSKIGKSFHRSEISKYASSIQIPLLDNVQIEDLRQRAIGAIGYPTTHKPVLHRQHGEHLSPRRGYGLDYDESRVYQPGDEMRFMNWRLTARTGELHVKIFQEERRPSAFILLDWRASMRFGTQVRLKAAQALRTAVLLIFYNHYRGRSLAGLVMGDSLRWLETGQDEQSILAMVSNINQACPPLHTGRQQADLASALRAIQNLLTPGSQLYLISDFIDATNDCRSILSQLAAEYDVSAVHIIDPVEQQLPKAGKLCLNTTTDDTIREVDTSNSYIAEQYQHAAQRFFADRESLLRGLGMAYVRMPTHIDNIEAELAFK